MGLLLTRGGVLAPLSVLASLDPLRGSFTAVCPSQKGFPSLIGRMVYTPGERSAHLAFLLPVSGVEHPGLPALMESLAVTAGAWGALNLLAEVEETQPALEAFRRSGFAVYGWQTIWKFDPPPASRRSGEWRPPLPTEENAVRSLYQLLVPPLVQAAEPFAGHTGERLVYRQGGEILAYADLLYGPEGVFIQPLLHPGLKQPEEALQALLGCFISLPARPVYVAARSYQAWLEPVLNRLGGYVSPRQALLVRHLVATARVGVLARQIAGESFNHEATVPMIQSSTIYKN